MIVSLQYLRAVAALMVVAFHAADKLSTLDPDGQSFPFTVGLAGVDIFFVISGFIITRLFFAELSKTKTISIGRFYFRRFLRLTPALFVCVFAIAATTVAIGEPFSFVPVVAALVQMKNYQTLFCPITSEHH